MFFCKSNFYSGHLLKTIVNNIERSRSFSQDIKSNWSGTVGLEVHAQLNTLSKLFSGSSTSFGNAVNSNVSYFDAAIPGTLPVLNRKCVEKAVMTALALNCNINAISTFDRKHYFYADLPAGYQITQQRLPLATDGYIDFLVNPPGKQKSYSKKCRIKQVQLEQDSGKSLHDDNEHRSLIDLNRAGVGLIEIVFEPDLSDGEEAAALIKELSLILSALDVCSCKMEEGALRIDANVSVKSLNDTKLGVRSEVKNISSIRGVCKAVQYELDRHIAMKLANLQVINETRAWDPETSSTLPMRDKEVKQDYRFMPEPNLPPLRLNTGSFPIPGLLNVEELKRRLPPLPSEIREQLVKNHSLSVDFADRLVDEAKLLNLFYDIMKLNSHLKGKTVSNLLINEFLTFVNKGIVELSSSCMNSKALAELCELIEEGKINTVTTRNVLKEILNGHNHPKMLVAERDWCQITDVKILTEICQKAIDENKKLTQHYKSGKTKVFSAFVGYIAKMTNNKANLDIASKILKELLVK